MVCEDTPDLGANSNIEGYTWNNQNVYRTMINITCPIGKAFDTLYVREIVNQCGKHDASSSEVTWKYNSNNPLPNCIGKIMNMIFCN